MLTQALVILYLLLALIVAFCLGLLLLVLRSRPPLRDMLAGLLCASFALQGGLLAGLAGD